MWSVTSYTELRREAIATERWNRLHPAQPVRKTYIETALEGAKGPIIAASDYMKALPDVLAPWLQLDGKCRLVTLGTDGFGRSDNRERLRRHFEVNAESIAGATLSRLAREGKIKGAEGPGCAHRVGPRYRSSRPGPRMTTSTAWENPLIPNARLRQMYVAMMQAETVAGSHRTQGHRRWHWKPASSAPPSTFIPATSSVTHSLAA